MNPLAFARKLPAQRVIIGNAARVLHDSLTV